GHFANGVVGAALATGRKAVALLGDTSMLLGTELLSAVQYRAPAVWVVLNDAAQPAYPAPNAGGQTRLDSVGLARACGAQAVRVERESELQGALNAAMESELPFVVDVRLDSRAPAVPLRAVRRVDPGPSNA